MADLREIITKISDLTLIIITEYPELYQYLDENPVTLPTIDKPVIDEFILEEYLRSLESLLRNHIKSHR